MTSEQRTQIQAIVRNTPKSAWEYWPFLLPVIVFVVGVLVVTALVVYFERKLPDLEVLFKSGKRVEPVWDSQLVREAVMVTAMSITITFLTFIYLARLAFRYATLLKTAAKDLGINEG